MTKWISVKDRLPEMDEEDLLLCETCEGPAGTYYLFHIGNLEEWDENGNCWNLQSERYLYGDGFSLISHWAKIEPPEVTE
jgi:hypothetical protein